MSYSVYFKYGGRRYKLPVNPEEIKKGPNDVKRFLKRTATTKSGEKAIVEYILDEDKIREEEKYGVLRGINA